MIYITCISFLLFKGSISEEDRDKLYNNCTVFSHTGEQLTKCRKVSVSSNSVVNDMTGVTAI